MKDKDLAGSKDARPEQQNLNSRRAFLLSTRKWSMAVVAGAVFGALAASSSKKIQAASWINRGGGGWVNRRGGGGGWINR
jgi:hypothetical protein